MKTRLIIDVDTGVDDAHAIMLALAQPEFDVVAITCVAGNCNVDQVCINTLKVLTVFDRLEVPVFKGSEDALVEAGVDATHYHGHDGLGDANLDIKVSMDQVQKEHAVTALVRLVNESPGEITLVALGPLTNIALAIRQDPDFGNKLKNVTIMGGNLNGQGNCSICGEFNFASDPHAAYAVLRGLKTNITLLPYDINLTSAAGQPWEWFNKWTATDTPKGRFVKAISQLIAHKTRDISKIPVFKSCDLNAMVTVVDPSVILETQQVYSTVELYGKYTRGMMVTDWGNRLGMAPNVTLVNAIDVRRAISYLDKMLL